MHKPDGELFVRVDLYNCGQVPAREVEVNIQFMAGRDSGHSGTVIPVITGKRGLIIPPQRPGQGVDFAFVAEPRDLAAATWLNLLRKQNTAPDRWRCEVNVSYQGITETVFQSRFTYSQPERGAPAAAVSSLMS
jgi:hypothetical protein